MSFNGPELLSFLIEFEHLYIIHRFPSAPSTSHNYSVTVDDLASQILPLMLHLSVFKHLTLPCVCVNFDDSVGDAETIEASKDEHFIPNHIQGMPFYPVR